MVTLLTCLTMTKNNCEPSRYGDSGFRRFDTFGDSGIKVVHSNETPTAPSRVSAKGCHTNPSMKPMQNMVYQPTHKKAPITMVGNRPTRSKSAPPTGITDSTYQDVLDSLGADESEPITGEERHTAEVYLRDEFGESNSNVF